MKSIKIILLFTFLQMIVPKYSYCTVITFSKVEHPSEKHFLAVRKTPAKEWILLVGSCLFWIIGCYGLVQGIISFIILKSAAYAFILIFPSFLIIAGILALWAGFGFYRLYTQNRNER